MSRGSSPAAALACAPLRRRFDRALRRVRHNADAEAIHDLRVVTRRLATVLQVWRGALAGPLRRRTRRELRSLRRCIAEARDLQVLVPALRARQAAEPAPHAVLDVWVRELESDLATAVAEAAHGCDPHAVAALRAALRQAAAALILGAGLAARREARAVLARAQRRARSALRAAIVVRDVTGASTQPLLHRARLRIKGWRYAEELAGSAPRARRAERLQEGLGAIHDLLVLRARAAARNGLSTLARSLDDEAQRRWDGLRPGLVAASRDPAAFAGQARGAARTGERG